MTKRQRLLAVVLAGAGLAAAAVLGSGYLLVGEDAPARSDAAVVLLHGIDVYARIEEAALLYREGWVGQVVINGNRKPHRVREWEAQGMKVTWRWEEEFVGILTFLGVPRERIVTLSAEDAFDTVSEARIVGEAVIARGIRSVIITTSRYHTRRAGSIWKGMYRGRLTMRVAGARGDFFRPWGWWTEGRQVKVLLSELGAWLFLPFRGGFAGS
jgi:uncharacterized SAM-binding protein YcdF (DUF218 family)